METVIYIPNYVIDELELAKLHKLEDYTNVNEEENLYSLYEYIVYSNIDNYYIILTTLFDFNKNITEIKLMLSELNNGILETIKMLDINLSDDFDYILEYNDMQFRILLDSIKEQNLKILHEEYESLNKAFVKVNYKNFENHILFDNLDNNNYCTIAIYRWINGKRYLYDQIHIKGKEIDEIIQQS